MFMQMQISTSVLAILARIMELAVTRSTDTSASVHMTYTMVYNARTVSQLIFIYVHFHKTSNIGVRHTSVW